MLHDSGAQASNQNDEALSDNGDAWSPVSASGLQGSGQGDEDVGNNNKDKACTMIVAHDLNQKKKDQKRRKFIWWLKNLQNHLVFARYRNPAIPGYKLKLIDHETRKVDLQIKCYVDEAIRFIQYFVCPFTIRDEDRRASLIPTTATTSTTTTTASTTTATTTTTTHKTPRRTESRRAAARTRGETLQTSRDHSPRPTPLAGARKTTTTSNTSKVTLYE